MQTLMSKHWHHLPVEECAELLESDPQKGLDLFEVRHRQDRFGPNRLTPRKGKSPLVRFLLQFNNPLIYILLASSLITAIVKDIVDAAVIFGVVLVNAIIGYVQEAKAEKAIEALAIAMETEAVVIRAGVRQRIPASELVPGDLVVLASGDKVPADMRLLRSRDLKAAEAALTGESLPVEKEASIQLSPDVSLADRRNMVYASTLITFGQGTGLVTATGDNTEVGRISQLISQAEELTTPLTHKIEHFSKLLLWGILALAAVSFAIGVVRGQPVIDTLTAAIALAVAMIPEGLPAALTVTLAIGVSRMARRQAIIRKLPAVETLGSVTVICSDKTGTLTQNQMTVQEVVINEAVYQVSGSGYDPTGEIVPLQVQTQRVSQASPAVGVVTSGQGVVGAAGLVQKSSGFTGDPLAATLRAGLLCNDGDVRLEDGRWQAHGDPTEVALVVSAYKGGLDVSAERQAYLRLDEIPFDSEYQYMATLHTLPGDESQRVVFVKGAAEVLLERASCALVADGSQVPVDQAHFKSQIDDMAARGLRVLALAQIYVPQSTGRLDHEMLHGLTLLGLQGMIDPPRPEAVAAVQAAQRAGIEVKMITGDHALTAAAIARQIGLDRTAGAGTTPHVLTGREMAQLSDRELIEAASTTAVFARVSPEQKLRLVEALQSRHHVVAMTGDGVNDGPALKQANVGVAMGIAGTEVAKEAADMVLTDDNFATIEAAVEEGRTVYDNLTKIIAWTLPTNVGEGLVILLALFLGVALPILPIQILWINMVSVAVLGLVLALEGREPNIMSRPPRDPQAPILTRTLLWRVLFVGAIILAGAFGLFEWELIQGHSLDQARTVAVNVVVAIGIFYLFNVRSLTHSMFQIGVFSNPWVWAGTALMVALQLAFTYVPVMNRLFGSAPIGLDAWVRIFLVGLAGYVLVEIEKWLQRRKRA